MLGEIYLHYCLTSWAVNLKCSKIIIQKSKTQKEKIVFYLNALDHRKRDQEEESKKVGDLLIEFYLSIFDKKANKKSVKACVDNHTTFFIQLYDRKEKEPLDIIVTIAFSFDENKENVFICWLGFLKICQKILKILTWRNLEICFRIMALVPFLL